METVTKAPDRAQAESRIERRPARLIHLDIYKRQGFVWTGGQWLRVKYEVRRGGGVK